MEETVSSGLTDHLKICLVETRNTNHQFGTRIARNWQFRAFGQSVDGLEESGCGTGPMNVPKIK